LTKGPQAVAAPHRSFGTARIIIAERSPVPPFYDAFSTDPTLQRRQQMNVRNDATILSPAERKSFVDALLSLKKNGVYDRYVKMHADSMMQVRAFANEPQDMKYRNAAHSGPVAPL
jgi:hypothetical protein